MSKRSAGIHPNAMESTWGGSGNGLGLASQGQPRGAPAKGGRRATSCLMITLTARAAIPGAGHRGASEHASHHVQGGSSSIHRGASQGSQEREARGTMGTTIATYPEAVLGKVLVRDSDVGHVHRVLEPTWTTKPPRPPAEWVEAILGWAQLACQNEKPMAHNVRM